MTSQLLPGLFSDEPIASQAVTVSPTVRAARRSGRQRVVSTIHARMLRYRNCVTLGHGPATDHEAAAWLGVPLASVNAARGDWGLYAAHCKQPELAPQPITRVRKDWGSGRPTTRVKWGFR